jgi:glycosyltransferase involved in cell wall biosynthesis
MIKILIPLYNDWDALELLLCEIKERNSAELFAKLSFVIVDDCSSIPCNIERFSGYNLSIIRLWRNVSHQKAIALGLAYLTQNNDFESVIVMDSDGEDRPADIQALYEASVQEPHKIIFAKRSKRSEGLVFRVGYSVYKFLFGILTGKTIEFGNFSILPFREAKKLAYVSEIWNHFSGGIIRSKLPYTSIPIERGIRLAGKSKMNFVSLVLHGLSAVSVHLDTVAVRILIGSLGMISLAIVGAVTVLIIKFLSPENASPGWATTLVTASIIVILQAFLSSLFLIFTVLNYRTQKHFIPAKEYSDFIEKVESCEV